MSEDALTAHSVTSQEKPPIFRSGLDQRLKEHAGSVNVVLVV